MYSRHYSIHNAAILTQVDNNEFDDAYSREGSLRPALIGTAPHEDPPPGTGAHMHGQGKPAGTGKRCTQASQSGYSVSHTRARTYTHTHKHEHSETRK